MGHHQYSKQVFEDLIFRLNQYQIGAPETAEMFEILSLLFKEEEALVGSCFPIGPTTLKSLAKKTGRTAESLKAVLESMAEKGLVMDRIVAGHRYYLLTPTLFGFFEFTFMRQDRNLPYKRLAALLERLLEKALAEELFSSKTPMSRTLVYEKSLDAITSTVMPYDRVSELIRSSGSGSIQDCFCRRKAHLLEKKCQVGAPVDDVCIALGGVADFLIRRGFAKKVDTDTLLRILDKTEKLGLVHITDNVRDDPQFICNCCGCCCELLRGINQFGYERAINPSHFQLKVIEAKCNRCGACAKSCQVKALLLPGRGKIKLDASRCLGCGVCVSRCAHDALILVERSTPAKIPKNYITRHIAITRQKGRLHHSIAYLAGAAFSRELLDFFKTQEKK